MPVRLVVSTKIADILKVLAHPQRVLLIEELASGGKDVRSLEKIMSIPQSSVSQHLSLLKSHGIVVGVREGKHVHYSLAKNWLAAWLLQAVQLIEEDSQKSKDLMLAAVKAKKVWKRPL